MHDLPLRASEAADATRTCISTRRSSASTSSRFDSELAGTRPRAARARGLHERRPSGVNGTPTFYINGRQARRLVRRWRRCCAALGAGEGVGTRCCALSSPPCSRQGGGLRRPLPAPRRHSLAVSSFSEVNSSRAGTASGHVAGGCFAPPDRRSHASRGARGDSGATCRSRRSCSACASSTASPPLILDSRFVSGNNPASLLCPRCPRSFGR